MPLLSLDPCLPVIIFLEHSSHFFPTVKDYKFPQLLQKLYYVVQWL